MSRSRRKKKLGKCFCGKGLIPYKGLTKKHGRLRADCPVLHYPHEENARWDKFFRRRLELKAEIDHASSEAQ